MLNHGIIGSAGGNGMSEIIRFGVSMDTQLVTILDQLTQMHHYPNRSETIRAMVRKQALQEGTEDPDASVTATISLIFHYKTSLTRVPLQQFPSLRLITNLQMHLEKDIVIKILVVSGTCAEVQQWSDMVLGQKQVVGSINIVATERLYAQLRP